MLIRSLFLFAVIGWIGCSQPQEPVNHDDSAWGTRLEEAVAKAKGSGKHVFVDFTGSDWCPPCKILHNNYLAKLEFKAFAEENLELVMLDFPQRKPMPEHQREYNKGLAQKYEIEGYPTVVILDGEGKEVYREGGTPDADDVANYVAHLKKVLNR